MALENYTTTLEEVVTKEELYNGIKYIADKINKLRKNLIIEKHVHTIIQKVLQGPIVTISLL